MLPLFAVPEVAVHAAAPRPADAPPPRENAIHADLGLAVVGLGFEHAFERRLAFQLTGHVFGTWFGPAFDKPNLSGFGGGARASFFLTGDAPRGLYVAPFLRVDRVTVDEPGAARAWGYSTGAFAGWSWLVADHLNVRVGGGAQWLAYEVPVGARRESFRGFFPALDLVVGYAF